MEWLWTALLMVASWVPATHSSLEQDATVRSIDLSQTLHIEEERNLLVLTPAGMAQMLNETRFLMVLFHNSSSKKSKNLAEELGKAVRMMGKGKNGIAFGKVDITTEKELKQEFFIKKAPELRLFFEGNRSEPISCEGVVESAALVVWLRRQISQKAILFNNSQQVIEFVNSRPLVIIGFFQDLEEEVAEVFYNVIKDFPELTFGVMEIKNTFGRFHVILDSVLVFKKGRVVNRQELINDNTYKQDLQEVIRNHLTDSVIEYNSESKDLIYEMRILNHMLLFASRRSESYRATIRQYKLASKEFQNKILFILVDTDEHRNRHILEYFHVTKFSVPSVQILNLSSDARYKMPSDEITYENLKDFGGSFLSRRAKKHQSSEEIRDSWDQGLVKQLVGKNFNVVVFDKERDVFVMFYAPWSEKCRVLFPLLEDLGRKYQNHSTVIIAKIDITANDIQLTNPDRYPFFRLFPTNAEQAVPYTGEHTLQGISGFLESQVKIRIEDEDELLSIEQNEMLEEEVLAEEEGGGGGGGSTYTEPELPGQQFPEQLENVSKVEALLEELSAWENDTKLEMPGESLPEQEDVPKVEVPVGQKKRPEKEEEVAKPKRPPRREKKFKVKEEL
ncbi:protein disulfide-isomerase-like protein of the testis [Fukomys damarensis]|uniref:Protein disulfide-isomerase-like protein of the testis n=1 Tax=Fukomys damarensis TaxID=885580 RepID=A0A091CSY2_FUKDA|nr:protein disulfide-isomerase-like protein of the testis [Fukomys damarensis]XP_010608344.1 protein disulfide-isomerase-like protein of the testis [Fukomys damarensis]XP_010608345.1 protein disulfide-isomerase-like protein of the testis [Fukomys damarensis]XP_010608346.1 protein disulfide-isomerase-like protein of the testis [Fukomys damarensis]XP_010608347.1 protein disulfide-isomerase-like protein of the testis [Fukomys damarensis]KFO21013.1 Protein disulfide-isomerase-like protein of the t